MFPPSPDPIEFAMSSPPPGQVDLEPGSRRCGGDCECSDFNLCLRAFEIKVTIPSDPFGRLAGTYEINQEGYFPGVGNRYEFSSCMQMAYISEELEIILETSYYQRVGSYWSAQVFSDVRNAFYGNTYAKGIVQEPILQMPEPRGFEK